MKFSNRLDLELFLSEVDQLDLLGQVNESYQPSDELQELFIKRRKPLVGAIKDFRRSQKTKEAWKKSRWKFMKGIKRFHNSTEGKRFHRNMARFLSSRYFHPTLRSIIGRDQDQSDKESRHVKEDLSIFDLAEILKAITSAKTHSFIELEYYMPLLEEVDYWEFLDEILPALDAIEKKLWLSERLDDRDLEVLFRLTEKKELIKALSEFSGIEYKTIEESWNIFESSVYMEEDICLNLIKYIGEKYANKVQGGEIGENS
jgi:hypothetical protein